MSRIVFLLTFLLYTPLPAQLARIPDTTDWRVARSGLQWTELELRAGSWRLPVRAIVVRMDPRKFDLELTLATRANGMTGVWNVDSAAADAALAFNAGQFKETGPWGWLILDTYEKRDPGFGPLSAGIAIDTTGALRWIPAPKLAAARRDRSIRFAFQSYPLLLLDGAVPPLLFSSDDVDRTHRDARLILAQLSDGDLLIVLTRYDGFAGLAPRVPIGLTVPESLQLIRALGARHAVMLDGGISAQLLLRTDGGDRLQWNGLRNVPLALTARPRRR